MAGDASLVLKVRTPSTDDLEGLPYQLYALPGVTSERSCVLLTYLERLMQPGVTEGAAGLWAGAVRKAQSRRERGRRGSLAACQVIQIERHGNRQSEGGFVCLSTKTG